MQETTAVERPSQKLKFNITANGAELMLIYLKTALLSLVTFGIYSFWGKIEIAKYLAEGTNMNGGSFGFHATGKEKFLGFLKAIGLFIIFFAALAMIGQVLRSVLSPQIAESITSLILFVSIIAVQPIMAYGSWRFRLSRSSWNNIRFRFTADIKEFTKEYFKGALLSAVTLGIYYPFFMVKLYKMFIDNSYLGNKKFEYNADGNEFFWLMFKGIVLTIITFGIYSFWLNAKITRYQIDHAEIDGNKFSCTINGGDIFLISVGTYLITVFTMGIAFPWAVTWAMKKTFSTISLDAIPSDFDNITNVSDQGASALSDGLSDAAEALDAISGAF